ncbi:MAG: hypothetical protein LBR64_10940 [Dysgonamonadaceae bacterium]|jgi:hypothetical protein|nr:hypothetical protein [Dysgonamonadaceae bacterium]
MNFNKRLFSAIFTVSICCAITAFPQQTKRDSTSMNREMTLEREYNPDIKSAAKISLLPELREPQTVKSKIEFSNYATPFPLDNSLFALNPKAMLTDLNISKNRGYITAGVSSLLDIDGDAGYHILDDEQNLLGVWFSHRSSCTKIMNNQTEQKQRFKLNDNWGGINFIHSFDNFRLLTDAGYTRSTFNYSGLCAITNLLSSSYPEKVNLFVYNDFPNQTDDMFETSVGIASKDESSFYYKIGGKYTLYKQKYGMNTTFAGRKENRILFDLDIHSNYDSDRFFGFKGAGRTNTYSNVDNFYSYFESFSDSQYDYVNQLKEQYGNSDFSVLTLNPYYFYKNDNLDLLLGAKVDIEFGGRKKWNLAPAVHFRYYPTESFMFYAAADGGRADNSNYNMFYENRYVYPEYRVRDSRSPLDARIGIDVVPTADLHLGAFAAYRIVKDEHFYTASATGFIDSTTVKTSNSLAGTNVEVEYKAANVLKIGFTSGYSYQDIASVDVSAAYNKWTITDNYDNAGSETAWGKPNLEADIDFMFRMRSIPLKFNVMYHGEFNRKCYVGGQEIRMEQVNDMSAKAAFAIVPNFSVWALADNILNSKYDLWYGYPAKQFSLMGGVSFLF